MTLEKTSSSKAPKGGPTKDTKRSRSGSSRSSHSRSRSSSRSSRSSSSSASSRSSSPSSRSRSGSRSSRSSRSSSSSSRSSGYKRRFRSDTQKAPISKKRSPNPTRLYIGRLTRNINRDHIYEIFNAFGKVLNVEMPMDRIHPHLNRGFAYVEYDSFEEAEKAVKYMDGGQIDGQAISASKVDLQKARGPGGPPPPPLPPRRGGGPGPAWRHGSPIRRRRSPLPRRSPPRRRTSRSRSRSPIRDRRRRDSRSSSSGSSR